MSKDGTNRGGARAGAGRKPKATAEKYANGNPGGRKLTVVEFEGATLEGCEVTVLPTKVAPTNFTMKKITNHFPDPLKHAEYLYSLIESEAI